MLDFKGQTINGELKTKDNGQLYIDLINGEFDEKSICVLSTESEKEYILLPSNILKSLLERIKKLQEESFEMSLERDIANQMPLDFEDVMSVARAKIKENHLQLSQMDCNTLVKEIKKEYPNLFYNINKYTRK